MKENSIKELQERLETLHVIQDARLACNADDLDIREEIAEIEEEIKELQDDTNVNRENSIKNERCSIEEDIERLKLCSTNQCHICGRYEKEECMLERNRCEQHILSDYKRVLKENEELKNIELKSKGGAIKVSLEGVLSLENKIKQLEKENEELKFKERSRIIGEYGDTEIHDVINKTLSNDYISVQKVKDIIDRIDYDIKKTKEIISKNTNIYASYRKNDYQIVRLRAMNTKSLDIKKRLQELLESEE